MGDCMKQIVGREPQGIYGGIPFRVQYLKTNLGFHPNLGLWESGE